jgi:hypothetical protein
MEKAVQWAAFSIEPPMRRPDIDRAERAISNPPTNTDSNRLHQMDLIEQENRMRASTSLFCFTSNKIDIHPCPNCRAPMLFRVNPAGADLSVRTFECFNCDTTVATPGDPSELAFKCGSTGQ